MIFKNINLFCFILLLLLTLLEMSPMSPPLPLDPVTSPGLTTPVSGSMQTCIEGLWLLSLTDIDIL